MSEPARGEGLSQRALGAPLLFAVTYSAVGFSLYFSLGVVADRGLGLTPLLFLGAGLLFVLATMSFAEGGAMFLDRGGSSNLARHAFNELISFIAAWALLIDFILVIALAAVSAPHYLSPIWDGFSHGTGEVLTAVGIVAAVAAINIAGWLGAPPPAAAGGARDRRPGGAGAADRRGRRRGVRAVAPDREPRPVHLALARGRGLRAGDRDRRVRRDRGGGGLGARPRVGCAGPAAFGHGRRGAAPDPLRGGRGGGADGGAGGDRPERSAAPSWAGPSSRTRSSGSRRASSRRGSPT